MAWHTYDEVTERRLTACVQTRSGLAPVWETAKELASSSCGLLDLVQSLIRDETGEKADSFPAEPTEEDAVLRDDAAREVEAFFRTYEVTYITCYYIAIAVFDGFAYNDIRSFADALWAEFQNAFGEVPSEELRKNTILSVRDILEPANAEIVETEEDGSTPWSQIIRFRNPWTARTCVRTVREDYPLLSLSLLRTSVSSLLKESSVPCRRLLSEWAAWEYPAVVRAVEDVMKDESSEESADKQYFNPAERRLIAALLDTEETAARTPRWRATLLEEAETLWMEETSGRFPRPTLRILKVIRILSGCAQADEAPIPLLRDVYLQLRGWANDWYQNRDCSSSRWAAALYALFHMDENEAFWRQIMRLLREDMESEQKAERSSGFACLTFLLYADCLLTNDGRLEMGLLRHCSAKRSYRAETAALLRRYCERQTRFLCLETILDEQLAILDEKDPESTRLWPFFKWMAFTGHRDDYTRWHEYLSNKVNRTLFPSTVSAGIITKMEKALASAQ